MLVDVLKMTAQNAALREDLWAMRAYVWFFTGVFSEVDLHVATLCESSSTTFMKAHECSLVSVRLVVKSSDGLAHLL